MKEKFDPAKPFLRRKKKKRKQKRTQKKKIKYLDKNQVKKLLKHLPGKMGKLAAIFALNTGLRVSELTGLVWNDLWRRNKPVKTLIVRAEIAKGNKEAEIPINGKARGVIYAVYKICGEREKPEPVFLNSRGKPLDVRTFQRWMKKAGDMAGLEFCHPHVLRHTYGTNLVKAGVNPRVIQDLMRHSNLNTTMIYTHVFDEDMRKGIDLI